MIIVLYGYSVSLYGISEYDFNMGSIRLLIFVPDYAHVKAAFDFNILWCWI